MCYDVLSDFSNAQMKLNENLMVKQLRGWGWWWFLAPGKNNKVKINKDGLQRTNLANVQSMM